MVDVVPLRSHPYADPSVQNGVSMALRNYFLSIIILKRYRSLTCLAAAVPGPKGVSVASALLVIEHNNIKKDRAFDIY